MIYLILFTSDCLTRVANANSRTPMSPNEATKQLSTHAVEGFALPGEAGFPLNNLYTPTSSRADAGESWRIRS